MRLGSEILFLVDLDTVIHTVLHVLIDTGGDVLVLICSITCPAIVSSLPLFCYWQSVLLLEIYFRLSLHSETCENE